MTRSKEPEEDMLVTRECEICEREYEDHAHALPPHICLGCETSFDRDEEDNNPFTDVL
jgi:hypothetical protein